MGEFIEHYSNLESESESEDEFDSEEEWSCDEYFSKKKSKTSAVSMNAKKLPNKTTRKTTNIANTMASNKFKTVVTTTKKADDTLIVSVPSNIKTSNSTSDILNVAQNKIEAIKTSNAFSIATKKQNRTSHHSDGLDAVVVPASKKGKPESTGANTMNTSAPKKRKPESTGTNTMNSSVPKKRKLESRGANTMNPSAQKKRQPESTSTNTMSPSVPKKRKPESTGANTMNPSAPKKLQAKKVVPSKSKTFTIKSKVQQLVHKKKTKRDDESGSKSLRKNKNDGWSSFINFEPKLFDFDESTSGFSSNVPQSSTISRLSFFELFFDAKLIDIIVEQSNKYHDSIPVRLNDSNKRKHQKEWVPIDRDEMYVFLATFLLMSAVQKSRMKDYWSRDALIETPMFARIITRDRFFAILQALHFNDNENQLPGDRLFKVRPVMKLLKERFSLYINPYKNLAIDESLMLWKGRLCFKQYIPSKRHRFGVKLYIICDCQTGAILDFIVYTGSDTEMDNFTELGISGSIVMSLMKPYLGKGHNIFLDNWYSSPKLYDELHKQKTGACGTVKKNRSNFPEFEELQRGEIVHMYKENLMAIKWQDKRDVHMLTSIHQAGFAATKKKDYRTNDNIWKPLAIIDYNVNMGQIDKSDMQISFAECVRKSVKWYKKFFFHLVDMTVLNCSIMFNMKFGKKGSLGKFRDELVRELLGKYAKIDHSGRRAASGSYTLHPKRLIDRHFPSKIKSAMEKRLKTRTCFVCSNTTRKQKKRSSTRFECTDCNVGLCVDKCFKQYHTLLHF